MKSKSLSELKKGEVFRFASKKQMYIYNGKSRGRNSKFLYYRYDDINSHYENTFRLSHC